jgi:aminoglycoside phosphotransferase (APT) family kinase protein
VISDNELIEAFGDPEATGVRREPYRYATSAALEDVRVLTAAGGEGDRLILKDLSRESLLDDALRTKPAFLHEPLRELETYRRIIGPEGIGPRCAAAVSEPDRARYWLLLERVAGVELWQIGGLDVWREVARWLASFHARFAGRLDELRAANPHLIDYAAEWFRSWRDRAVEALAGSDDARAGRLVDSLERYDEVVGRLESLPRAFVHGELYPSNVLVVADARPPAVYPVDWEMAGIGPALLDLAALSGGYADAERGAIVDAYIGAAGLADDRAGLAACRLALALQWLGWSPGWRPPDEHSHDWLGEALDAIAELELR